MYRNHVRIIADILLATYNAEGASVTHIIRKANISYNRLKLLLSMLIDKELIKVESIDGNTRYIISEKGKEFLNAYNRFYELAEGFGLKV